MKPGLYQRTIKYQAICKGQAGMCLEVFEVGSCSRLEGGHVVSGPAHPVCGAYGCRIKVVVGVHACNKV